MDEHEALERRLSRELEEVVAAEPPFALPLLVHHVPPSPPSSWAG